MSVWDDEEEEKENPYGDGACEACGDELDRFGLCPTCDEE